MLNYLAFLQPAADRAVSILPWAVSPGRSYGFLWAGSIIQKNVRNGNPTPAYSRVSDRRRLTALVEVCWARRVQAPMPQISGPNLQENHIIETCKEEGLRRFLTGNGRAKKMIKCRAKKIENTRIHFPTKPGLRTNGLPMIPMTLSSRIFRSGRLPAEGRLGGSENTSNCLFSLPALPSLHMCHLFGIRSLVS
jgi:hypothetical protein